MNTFDAIVAIGAVTVMLMGLLSGYVRNRLWLSEPALCLMLGMTLSPLEFDLLGMAPGSDDYLHLFQEVARVTLAISVMGAALRLPDRYLQKNWRELLLILGLGLPLMWLSTSLLAYLTLSLPVLLALLLGAILAPTDPVLADSIVAGRTAERNVPPRLRNSITVESGANDGFAMLLVMLPVLALSLPSGEALSRWLTEVLLWQVLGGGAIGGLLGWVAGRALLLAYRQPYSERVSGLTVSIALALSSVACVHLIGSSGILAAFVAGVLFARFLGDLEDPRHEHVQEAIGRFFDLPVFVLLGLATPWGDWVALGWSVWLFVLLVLALRRLPAWLLLRPLLPSLESRQEAMFNGWFGPIGIAALYYAAEATTMTGRDELWTIGSLVVFASVLAHGISATPLVRAYPHGRPAGAQRR